MSSGKGCGAPRAVRVSVILALASFFAFFLIFSKPASASTDNCRELRLLVFLDTSHSREETALIISEADKFLRSEVGISLNVLSFETLRLWLGFDETYLFYQVEKAARQHEEWDLAVAFSTTGSQYDYGAMDHSRRYITVHNYEWMTLAHEILHAFYRSKYHSTEGILAAYYGRDSAFLLTEDKEEILANRWQQFQMGGQNTASAALNASSLQSGQLPQQPAP